MDEWVDADMGKQKYSEKNCRRTLCPPQTPHHHHHMNWPGIELGPHRWEAGD